MNYSWPSWATLAICVSCAAVQQYWGGQDKQGQFHAEYLVAHGNLGMSLFFLGPYVLLAMSSLIGWWHRAATSRLVLVAVLCAIGLMAGWIDHVQYLRTPPGRETPQMLCFLATIALWLGSVLMLVTVAKSRFINTRSPNAR
ncbi:MAG: hypothetical protein IAG10_22460 [Planctomycetaceae bacterium]|nr:hypothetical protein [Planctomycetaceae bacterium]